MEKLEVELKNQHEVIDDLLKLNASHSRELEMLQLAFRIFTCALVTLFILFTVIAMIGAVLLMVMFMTQIDTSSDVVELQIKNGMCALAQMNE